MKRHGRIATLVCAGWLLAALPGAAETTEPADEASRDATRDAIEGAVDAGRESARDGAVPARPAPPLSALTVSGYDPEAVDRLIATSGLSSADRAALRAARPERESPADERAVYLERLRAALGLPPLPAL